MHVKDCLARISVAVDDHPIAPLGHPEFGGQFGHGREELTDCLGPVCVQVVEGGDVFSRDEQDMHRRDRVDVGEGQAEFVFPQQLGRDDSVPDLAKQTVGHGTHLLEASVTRRSRMGQAGLRLAVVCLLLASVSACNQRLGRPKGDDLYGVVKRFHHNLRWKYNEDASARVDPRYSVDFRDQLEDAGEDLNITAWDLRKVEMDEKTKKATVRIQLRYYKMPSTVLESEKVEQVWQLVDDNWFMLSWEGGPLSFPPEGAEKPEDDSESDSDSESKNDPKKPDPDPTPKDKPKRSNPAPTVREVPNENPDMEPEG
jgi:hypothetical protein